MHESIEQMFEHLTSTSLGMPARSPASPAASKATATLLILREFMHQLDHRAITVVDAACARD